MKKLLTVTLTIALLTVMLFTGCGNNDGGEATGTVQDTITFAQSADITSLDPHVGKQTVAITVTGNIFDTLVKYDSEMNIVPNIAESWEVLSDTSVKFNIRKGIKFHDGSELTAKDVKYSIERILDHVEVSYILDFVSDVEIEDDYTVIVNTSEPFGPILAHFAYPAAAIVPMDVVEADPEGFALNPVGSGPYKFVEWKQGEYCKLEAFEDYYAGKALTQNVVMKVVPEAAQRTIQLETGEIDLSYEVSANDVSKIEGNEELKMYSSQSLKCTFLTMNYTYDGPLKNKDVRHAIELAIDKQGIVDAVLYGSGDVASSVVPPLAFGYNPEIGVSEYNVEKAKELLAEAGYPDGFEISLWTSDDQTDLEMSQIVKSQLAEIGITVNLDVIEWGTLLSKLGDPDHGIIVDYWTTTTADANYTLYPLYHSTVAATAGNDSFYGEEDVDKLLDAAKVSLDADERMGYYTELANIVNEDLPYIPMYYPAMTIGANAGIEGLWVSPMGYHELNRVTLTK